MYVSIKILFVSFLMLFLSPASKANATLDSLLNALQEMEQMNEVDDLLVKADLSEQIADWYNKAYSDQEFSRIYLLQAISHVEKRISLTSEIISTDIIHITELYRKLSLFEAARGKQSVSDRYMKQCEKTLESFRSDLPDTLYYKTLFDIHHSKFALNFKNQAFSAAENNLITCYNLIDKSPVLGDMRMNILSELSAIYSAQGKFDEAIQSAEKGLVLFTENPQPGIPKDRYIYFVIRAYMNAGKPRGAIQTVKNRSPYTSFDELEHYLEQNSQMVIRTFFENLFMLGNANRMLFEKTDSVHYLENAYQWMNDGFLLAEQLTLNREGDKIGSILIRPKQKVQDFLRIFEVMADNNLATRDQQIAVIRILDVYQSSRLHLERISHTINATSWAREKELKSQLNFINTKLGDVGDNPDSKDSLTKAFNTLSYELFETKKRTKREQVLDEYAVGRTQFSDLMNTFLTENDKTGLIYFFANEIQKLYICGITAEDFFFRGIEVSSDFAETIQRAYALNANFQSESAKLGEQDSLNHSLYDVLIAPVKEAIKTENVLLFPLNELSYVSFDALLDTKNQYLVHSYNFHYASSLFSIINPRFNLSSTGSSISFYPSDYGTDSLAYLTNAKEEVELFSKKLNAQVFEGKSATKFNFLSTVKESKVVHLASHSVLNVEQPYESYIVFDTGDDTVDNRLFAYEIFSTTIQADLVALSSCNSAKGAIEEGIGVVSLSNAFYFAGVPSTISSMWDAQDKSSSEVMISFYEGLTAGNSKSLSLRNAKINYLKQADKVKKQPFFWANYVVYGTDEAIFKKDEVSLNRWITFVICTIVLVGGAILYSNVSSRDKADS